MKRTLLLSLFAVGIVSAQAPPAKQGPKQYTPPKTPWGDPDLQGNWPGSINIPLQRPENMGERAVLTEAEKKARDTAGKQRATTGTWIEYYPATEQASLVVDPKNGRLPPMTPEAERRNKAVRGGLGPPTLSSPEERAESVEDFDLWGRCITKGLVGSMLPGNLYNKGNRIIQAPGIFVIQNEMVHETRIVPTDGRPHRGKDIRTYMGDARGHWEGESLVVESTNFNDRSAYRNANAATLRLVERFTRTAPNRIEWAVTVDDSRTWTRPWTFSMPLTMNDGEAVLEFACHEGNYAVPNILSAARSLERAAHGR